jgi:hypothetical protein
MEASGKFQATTTGCPLYRGGYLRMVMHPLQGTWVGVGMYLRITSLRDARHRLPCLLQMACGAVLALLTRGIACASRLSFGESPGTDFTTVLELQYFSFILPIALRNERSDFVLNRFRMELKGLQGAWAKRDRLWVFGPGSELGGKGKGKGKRGQRYLHISYKAHPFFGILRSPRFIPTFVHSRPRVIGSKADGCDIRSRLPVQSSLHFTQLLCSSSSGLN